MTEHKPIEWAARLAHQCETQAVNNVRWRAHYARTLPPGRERRSRLWRLAYHARRNEQRAIFWREVSATWIEKS